MYVPALQADVPSAGVFVHGPDRLAHVQRVRGHGAVRQQPLEVPERPVDRRR